MLRSETDLLRVLERIDGRGFKAYLDLRGSYELPAGGTGETGETGELGETGKAGERDALELHVDHVQGDPFAAPSRVRVRIPLDELGWNPALFQSRIRRTAFEDHLARRIERAAGRERPGSRGSGKSGLVGIDAGGQEVLERTAVVATPDWVEARLEVGLPATGRRILGREAEELLLDAIPEIARAGMTARDAQGDAETFLACIENHAALQAQLSERGLVAFVADGAVLPRQSGASQRPMAAGAVALAAPASLRVELEIPNPVAGAHRLSGLAIHKGVTLIVGGGYHGKSTLLRALERGVYAHVPGDGREQVATLPSAVKVRAEDGRRVVGCDIHGFIADLPGGRSTRAFSSDDASGSTSQAAGIVEAVEAGASALLIDEDTSATNFMVRDARMQALVSREHEPITPFVDRVRELYDDQGVSTVLVMGGSGDYFDVADTVLEMAEYLPRDVTAEARRIAQQTAPQQRSSDARAPLRAAVPRVPRAASIDPSKGRREVRIDVRGADQLGFGVHSIDLRGVEQLVDPSQTRSIGYALSHAAEQLMQPGMSVPALLDSLEALFDEQGLEALTRRANLARPRRFEIAAALSRLRSLEVEST